jgi:hypothetical protein
MRQANSIYDNKAAAAKAPALFPGKGKSPAKSMTPDPNGTYFMRNYFEVQAFWLCHAASLAACTASVGV